MPQISSLATITAVLCFCSCLSYTNAFIAPSPTYTGTQTSSHSTPSTTSLSATRRNFLTHSIATLTAATSSAIILPAQPALAKEAIEITPEAVQAAFDAIRNELTSSDGVVATLSNLIDNGSFEEILQYTKESDAYFRKAKMGKARKLLTDKDLKGEAVLMSNAVTFDLIGINRASRPGKESREDQLRYLGELRKDIEKFLELEKTIVFE